MSEFKDYIGDGVYAEMEGYMIKLTTEREGGMIHTIYLEPEVYAALVDYVERVRGARA
jgi:hypothetical protein